MAANSKVFMAAVRYATFQKDRIAFSRRDARVPRQTCVGGLCDRYQPDMVFCENLGADGSGGYTWQCKAELPAAIRFGELSVSCEGWDGPDDVFVLDGSCAVTYALERVSGFELNDEQMKLPSRSERIQAQAFDVVFYGMTFLILYTVLRKVILQHAPRWAPPPIPFLGGLGDGDGGHGGGGGPPGPGGGGGGGGSGGGGGNGRGGGFDSDEKRDEDTSFPHDFTNPDLKPLGAGSSISQQTATDTATAPAAPGGARHAGVLGGLLAATGLGALFATQAGRDTGSPRQRPAMQADTSARVPATTTRTAQAQAQQSARLVAARRRQTYEGFWGVDNGSIDMAGETRMATGFGSSSTR